MMKKHAVIGVGNPFRGDDGIGVFLLQKLQKQYTILKGTIDFIDGGTGGMNLFHLISPYEIVILVDAVDFNASPGAFLFFSSEDIKESKKVSSLISTHGCDVFSVLKNVDDHSDQPTKVFIFGVQPKEVKLSQGFSKEIQQNIPVYLEELTHRINEIF